MNINFELYNYKKHLMNFLNEGGSLFMYPLLAILILILVLLVKGLIDKKDNSEIISLTSSLGLFAIVWSFAAQIIGLMGAFEAIRFAGDISPAVMAEGLRISFIAPIFGMFIFLIGRLGIIVLTILKK
jgi:hypothetical protein